MSKKTIGILGCGWLGLPLAQSLIAEGYAVKGTTTRASKIPDLQAAGIQAFELVLTEDGVTTSITAFLDELDVLIIAIPPGVRANPAANFPKKLSHVLQLVNALSLEQLIFISSTSVFEDTIDFPHYNETHPGNATSNNGKQLLTAESLVRASHHTATIIRPAGLIGADRNPITMLAGKTGLKNPDAPVNLVHRDYLIILITQVLNGSLTAPILHAVSEPHSTRKDYYTAQARLHELEAPTFNDTTTQVGKFVNSCF